VLVMLELGVVSMVVEVDRTLVAGTPVVEGSILVAVKEDSIPAAAAVDTDFAEGTVAVEGSRTAVAQHTVDSSLVAVAAAAAGIEDKFAVVVVDMYFGVDKSFAGGTVGGTHFEDSTPAVVAAAVGKSSRGRAAVVEGSKMAVDIAGMEVEDIVAVDSAGFVE